jgi:opacity protein-like surface antigen
MKNACLHLLSFFLFSLTSIAQDTPWWELHAGYQFTGYRTGQMQNLINSLTAPSGLPAVNVGSHMNMNGWNFSVQENANSWFGAIVDFSGGYASKNLTVPHAGGTPVAANFAPALFTMGGGPQFSYRKSDRVQPFARIIFAAAYSNLKPNTAITNALSPNVSWTCDTAFAMIGGGGIDYRLKNYAYFRIAGDYIRTTLFNEGQNNFRITAGVTFRIVRK